MGTLSFPIASSKSRLSSTPNHPIAFSNPFLQSSFSSSPFRPPNFPILHLRRRVLCSAAVTGRSNHDDHQHVHDHHHHHHRHAHHHCDHDVELSGPQKAVIGFAKAIRLTDLANYLREHLQLCCCSMALFVAAAVCPYFVPKPIVKPLQNAFIVIAFPLVGVSSSLDALTDISGGKVNIHVLMALAAFASIFMGNALEGGLLLAMFNLSHIAEEHFTSRAMIDVKELKENYPDSALVLDTNDGKLPNSTDLSYQKVPVHDVQVDSYILVGAGEFVPVDCEVFQGSATVTIEHLTGEIKPLEITVGSRVPGGARNLDGRIIVKATKTWKESTLSRIVNLTEEAQLNKPRLQRWLDEFGEHYSKAVVVLAIAIALVGPVLFKWPFIGTSACRGSVYRALGLMVAASPCALAVAPLAYAIAISSCARKGILLKGGRVLDALASCHTIAFDKTGTLTTGGLIFKAIEPIYGHEVGENKSEFGSCCNPCCEEEALAVAAAMEKGTTHPIGRAVVDHSMGKDLPSFSVQNLEYFPGRGLIATLHGSESGTEGRKRLKASLGSLDFITSCYQSESKSREIKEAANTSSYGSEFVHAALAVDGKVTLIHLEDRPHPGVSSVIAELTDRAKLHVMMLTGDHESSARRVANAVGIKEVHFSLKPEDKLSHVKSISRENGGLIMVGEGINDAPALAAATVGIVLAQRASATAIAVADVLLLWDNISGVPFCIAKSRQTTALVKQNASLALFSIFVASLPAVLGFLPLWLTVLLHEGGTLLVCLNSIRALNNPSWSWKQDLKQLLMELKFKGSQPRLNTSSTTVQSSPV
ncbi:probable cadmium/zinc-transporting ATPase HMA1, chloroplastic isoform X1 [Benincasa hispida]|uniref:probable cadmium/zinc-transporting ATPase HMA1, chloroplastic isoform X1 n=1 Tax=Benincasa hispida TaxID=102211 RepID=UPI0019026233|nr:probable cadmium/zinc-transporting ATPase HMA1, chloroplastic isoform X1 [Benincasa hispida]XP_038900942.1 probable cadmium/zinc-transporting ATPase HMA1, chloroplastic isoform X1 [Benincasa hispida]XP_038900943.1 probable cadmium/zinc-transporting ATPase HMA1, chloroplastic isoform X1 [Benincasa hispida]